jgi:hypothetical protein
VFFKWKAIFHCSRSLADCPHPLNMPWSDVFPILDDEMVEETAAQWTEADEALFQEEFGIEYVTGRRASPCRSVLSVSLFGKPHETENPANRNAIQTDAALAGPASHRQSWDRCSRLLLDHAPRLIKTRPDITLRIYLAKNLESLVPKLAAFAEIVVMHGSSERSAPGMLWRLLALGEGGCSVTILDADLISTASGKIRVTDLLSRMEVCAWRVPVPIDLGPGEFFSYRTIAGCYWGTKVQVPIEKLLKAFRWWQRRGGLQTWSPYPATGREHPIAGALWPNYGTDEYFSNIALYPRLARSGFLTIAGIKRASYVFPLDIEYVSWANANSFIDYSLYDGITRISAY